MWPRHRDANAERDPLSPETIRFIASATDLDVAVLYRLMVVEKQSRQRQVLQGRVFGLAALMLMLGTVIVLSLIGQPWVAGVIGGTGLAVIVAVFVTGHYEPRALPEPRQATTMNVKEPSLFDQRDVLDERDDILREQTTFRLLGNRVLNRLMNVEWTNPMQ